MGFLGLKLNYDFPGVRQFGARKGLVILFLINLLNFADRYVPSAVKQDIIDSLKITDFQSSLPNTGMIVVYMIFAVIFGTISDKEYLDRRYILCGAIIFWSAATSLAGLSTGLLTLIIFRSLIGVGEAAYGTIAPPMLSDFYPDADRNVVYGVYYLAIPIGGALGFAIGAVLAQAFNWRVAFIAVGIPGIIVAVSALTINDPARGVNDLSMHKIGDKGGDSNAAPDSVVPVNSKIDNRQGDPHQDKIKSEASASQRTTSSQSNLLVAWTEFKEIMTNWPFIFALGGLTANNFALGGLAEWFATFLLRFEGASLESAGLVVGAATIIGGIGGTILGSKVADYYLPKIKSAYFLIPALFCIPGGILLLFSINVKNNFTVCCVLLFLAEICIWTYLAPISALSISCMPPRLRARSCGIQIFFQHVLGDIISPPIIGAISDTSNLRNGIQICWIFVFVSGLFWFAGYYFLPALPTQYDEKATSEETLLITGDNEESQYQPPSDGKPLNPKNMSTGLINGTGTVNELHRAASTVEDVASSLPQSKVLKETTYSSLFCGDEALYMEDGHNDVTGIRLRTLIQK